MSSFSDKSTWVIARVNLQSILKNAKVMSVPSALNHRGTKHVHTINSLLSWTTFSRFDAFLCLRKSSAKNEIYRCKHFFFFLWPSSLFLRPSMSDSCLLYRVCICWIAKFIERRKSNISPSSLKTSFSPSLQVLWYHKALFNTYSVSAKSITIWSDKNPSGWKNKIIQCWMSSKGLLKTLCWRICESTLADTLICFPRSTSHQIQNNDFFSLLRCYIFIGRQI